MAVKTFRCRRYDLHFVGLADVAGEWELTDPEDTDPLPDGWTPRGHDGPWKVFDFVDGDRLWLASAYRKRINLSTAMESEPRDSDVIEREIFEITRQAADIMMNLQSLVQQKNDRVRQIVYFPVADVWDYDIYPGLLRRLALALSQRLQKPEGARPGGVSAPLPNHDWLTERVTTFSYRMFDATKPHKPVYVRISRHLVICYKVSEPVLQDVFNLVHAKILYVLAEKTRESGQSPKEYDLVLSPDDVFGLTDGLTATTVPTELNLLLYETAARVAIVVALSAGALVVMMQIVAHHPVPRMPESVGLSVLIFLWVLGSILLWVAAPRAFSAFGVYRHD